jgi:hypothetical protein
MGLIKLLAFILLLGGFVLVRNNTGKDQRLLIIGYVCIIGSCLTSSVSTLIDKSYFFAVFNFALSVYFFAMLWYAVFKSYQVFLFVNQDLNKLGRDLRLEIFNASGVIINYYAADQCTYMYFTTSRTFVHFKKIFSLSGSFIPNIECRLDQNYETVVKKLKEHKIKFTDMTKLF